MRKRARRTRDSRSVGDLLEGVLARLGLESKLLERWAMMRWPEAVGKQIASVSRAETVRQGVMFVACKSSAWASEIALHKGEILRRINGALGSEIVRDLRLSSRGFRLVAGSARKERAWPEAKGLEAIALEEPEYQAAAKAAAQAPTPELAETILKAILTGKRRAKLLREPTNQERSG